jgi:hypothetical protein
MGHFSPKELYDGNLDGRLLYWRLQWICQGSRNGRLFPYVPRFWETCRDAPFLGPFKGGKKFLFKEIFMKNLRDR